MPLLLFVGPSGVGKDTLVAKLQRDLNIPFLVGYTSRNMRPGEIPGETMHFRSKEEMQTMVDENRFVVPTVYCNNIYGTLKEDIDKIMKTDEMYVAIMDAGGVTTMSLLYPDCRVFYITPPNEDELITRMKNRGGIDEIDIRMAKAKDEMRLMNTETIIKHKYVIMNDDLDTAYNQVLEHVRSFTKPKIYNFKMANSKDYEHLPPLESVINQPTSFSIELKEVPGWLSY